VIRNQGEYEAALRRIEQDRELAVQQRTALTEAGLSPEEVERAMQPMLSFHAQLEEEVQWYKRVQNRDFGEVRRLTAIGPLLIALRIASGLSQRDLAKRLGVSESQVSRDERNEYHGITLERAQRILDAIGERLVTTVEQPQTDREPAVV
jgi:DNA-binding XRE family transcriptional regulator